VSLKFKRTSIFISGGEMSTHLDRLKPIEIGCHISVPGDGISENVSAAHKHFVAAVERFVIIIPFVLR